MVNGYYQSKFCPDLDLIPDLELDPKLTAGLYLLVDPKQKVTLSENSERLAAKAH
jgi:hypothetical protein